MSEEQESHNIFKMLKVETKENYHSQFIISVINSSKDAKKLFLEMLQEVVKKNPEITINEGANFKIVSEKTLSKSDRNKKQDSKRSRVDIFFSDYHGENSKGNNRILIENKIYAREQKGQIARYYNHYWGIKAKEEYFGALFYLTLQKKGATKYSADGLAPNEHYFLLGYKEDIIPWLKKLKKYPLSENLTLYINDYISIVEELTYLSTMIEKEFKNDKNTFNIKKEVFDSYLELCFWNFIDERLRKDDSFKILTNRLYNYDEILLNHKGLGKKKEIYNYGIIFEKDNYQFRFGVKVDPEKGKDQFRIFISKGEFIDNKWKYLQSDFYDTEFCSNNLKDKKTMEDIAEKVIEKIKEKFF